MRTVKRLQKLTGSSVAVRRTGRIVATQNGTYVVETDAGTRIRCEGEATYRINQRVSVISGRIVGVAAGSKTIKAVKG